MLKYLKEKLFLRLIIVFLVILAVKNTIIASTEPLKPNDPLFQNQQKLFEKLNVFEAWKFTKGDPNILIGVIDNGFDFFHPDLEDNFIPYFYLDKGYHTEFYENIAHGTLVASIIAAEHNNDIGMAGLAPHCKILTASLGTIEHEIIKFSKVYKKSNPNASLAEIQGKIAKKAAKFQQFGKKWQEYQLLGMAKAIRCLVDSDAKVINISFGGWDQWVLTEQEQDVIKQACLYAKEKNVIIVTSAGNTARRLDSHPIKTNLMIVVGATLMDDSIWQQSIYRNGKTLKYGSNYGDIIDVMAPSEKLQICVPHEKRFYDIENGPYGPAKIPYKGMYVVYPNVATSGAAAVVTSLVGLIYSANPYLDAETVVEIIKKSCDDIGENGFDIYTGHGRVNFGKAIRIALARKK